MAFVQKFATPYCRTGFATPSAMFADDWQPSGCLTVKTLAGQGSLAGRGLQPRPQCLPMTGSPPAA